MKYICGKTKDAIDISSGIGGDDNEIKIKLTLERIVSRIDIKFIKVASDDDHIELPAIFSVEQVLLR